MEDLLISKNARYIVSSDRILDTKMGISTSMELPNPLFICEMLKNQFLFNYKNDLMESVELFSKMRKLSYKLMEYDKNVLLEYEIKFGQKLLFENIKSYKSEINITESWDFIKNKLIESYGFLNEGRWGWFGDAADWVSDKVSDIGSSVKSGVKSAVNWVGDKVSDIGSGVKGVVNWVGDKVSDAWNWVKNKGVEWFMTKIEDFLMSPVGIALDVALTAVGIGKLAIGIVWGILLVWKIYKYVTGKSDKKDVWTYVDIAVCLVGLIFSGAAKGLKMAFKAAGGSIAKVSGKVLSPIAKAIVKGPQVALNLLIKPFEWIAKLFGGRASSIVSSVKSGINGLFDNMAKIFIPKAAEAGVPAAKGFRATVKAGLKKDFVEPFKGMTVKSAKDAALKGVRWGAGTHLLNKGIEKGAKLYADYKGVGQPSPEDYKQIASAIPDDTIKQGVENDMNDILKQMS